MIARTWTSLVVALALAGCGPSVTDDGAASGQGSTTSSAAGEPTSASTSTPSSGAGAAATTSAASSGGSGGQGGVGGAAASTSASTGGAGGSTTSATGGGGLGPCIPITCDQQGAECGPAGDGCGHMLDCGTCMPPETCGGRGQNLCGDCECTPRNCTEQGISCGVASDGCGGIIECGGGCGPPDPRCCGVQTDPPHEVWTCGEACETVTCAALGKDCGIAPSGCGDSIDCGACTLPATCGGGGTPGVCGVGSCTKLSCADQGLECGPADDGCGGVLDCGACDDCTQGCGADTAPGHCAEKLVNPCVPTTCAALGRSCGPAPDTCGGSLDCGMCADGLACSGGSCVAGCI